MIGYTFLMTAQDNQTSYTNHAVCTIVPDLGASFHCEEESGQCGTIFKNVGKLKTYVHKRDAYGIQGANRAQKLRMLQSLPQR